jgi:hypothetical protein
MGVTPARIGLFRQPHIDGLFHEIPEPGHVVDALGLNEIGPGVDLVGQPVNPEFIWVGKWIGGRADEHLGRFVDILVVDEFALVAHLLHHGDELHGVDVVYVFGLGVVAELLVVAGEAEHVSYAQGVYPQDIGHHGQAVAVPAHHLKVGLEPHWPPSWPLAALHWTCAPQRSGCR